MKTEISGVIFDSDFENGNLARVEEISSPSTPIENIKPRTPPPKPLIAKSTKKSLSESTLCNSKSTTFSSNVDISASNSSCRRPVRRFALWTARDGEAMGYVAKSRTFFHFSVQIGDENEDQVNAVSCSCTTVEFRIRNLNRVARLFSVGMRPVYSVDGCSDWKPISSGLHYENTDEGLEIAFQFTFVKGTMKNTKCFFAYCYPYTYKRLQDLLAFMDSKVNKATKTPVVGATESRIPIRSKSQTQLLSDSKIYFHRELLIKSNDGHQIDLVTISSMRGIKSIRESTICELFPLEEDRCQVFDPASKKQIVFLSARVHPGETNSSFMMEGLLRFLLDEHDGRAQRLRDLFVFKVIPMLNVDGVVRGHYRMDVNGVNLNRVYDRVDYVAESSTRSFYEAEGLPNSMHAKFPSIWAAKRYMAYLSNAYSHENENVLPVRLYMDLHGHASKFGAFLFGNRMNTVAQRTQIQAFAKTMAKYCPHFDLNECDFSLQGMLSRDRSDDVNMTKEGSGRVAMFRLNPNLVHAYTFEANYFCSSYLMGATSAGASLSSIDSATAKRSKLGGKPGSMSNLGKQSGSTNSGMRRAMFTTETFEEMGKAILLSVLEISENTSNNNKLLETKKAAVTTKSTKPTLQPHRTSIVL